jgi:hypothetical protein
MVCRENSVSGSNGFHINTKEISDALSEMRNLLQRRWQYIWGGVLLVLLLGCSFQYEIVISGLETSSPIFEFTKSSSTTSSGTRERVELNSFRIVTKGAQGWDYKNPVWAFETKPGSYVEIGLIKYGSVPPGFSEIAPAKPLSVGVSYRAVAFGAGSGGEKEFMLKPIGG